LANWKRDTLSRSSIRLARHLDLGVVATSCERVSVDNGGGGSSLDISRFNLWGCTLPPLLPLPRRELPDLGVLGLEDLTIVKSKAVINIIENLGFSTMMRSRGMDFS